MKVKERERHKAELAALDMQHLANELIKAWQDWTAHPSEEYTAVRHEAAIQETAKRMGVTGTNLLIALSEKKMKGKMSVARTVRLLFSQLEQAGVT